MYIYQVYILTINFCQITQKELQYTATRPFLRGKSCCRLPHKDGNENRVGNPLSKSFLDKVKDGVMITAKFGSGSPNETSSAEKVLTAAKTMSYWKSNHERVRGQVVVETADDDTSVILPMVKTFKYCELNNRSWIQYC